MLAHTGHHSAAETIELTRHAAGAGAEFAVVINPYYPPATDEGLYRWFEQVCASAGIGIWLFDTGYSGVALSTGLIRRLATIENVCGIKVGRPHDRYLELLAAVGDTILVCSPHEETWLENMRDHGQRVYMSSAAPYLYQTPGWQPMRDYTRLALGGDIAGAEKTAATLDPVRAVAAKWLPGRPRRSTTSSRSRPGPGWSACRAVRSARRWSPTPAPSWTISPPTWPRPGCGPLADGQRSARTWAASQSAACGRQR